ncbi:hypothetical protein TIFTF001_018832 [Ficus carica]|uniref:Secreted protein n=1 Tax=Ficus carica TaxID=3494 RepID=A0AA88AS98_FICCA|nr:hypothetical protein TIFTF001_018832 [Ficus carica]
MSFWLSEISFWISSILAECNSACSAKVPASGAGVLIRSSKTPTYSPRLLSAMKLTALIPAVTGPNFFPRVFGSMMA